MGWFHWPKYYTDRPKVARDAAAFFGLFLGPIFIVCALWNVKPLISFWINGKTHSCQVINLQAVPIQGPTNGIKYGCRSKECTQFTAVLDCTKESGEKYDKKIFSGYRSGFNRSTDLARHEIGESVGFRVDSVARKNLQLNGFYMETFTRIVFMFFGLYGIIGSIRYYFFHIPNKNVLED